MPRPKPDPIDIVIASKVSVLRSWRQMTQKELGEKIGVSFQQIQKYERAADRIAASRLYQIAHVLDVPVSIFFTEMKGLLEIEDFIEAQNAGEID